VLVLGVLGFVSACGSPEPNPEAGQNLAVTKGCSACHAVDDTPNKIGPTWVGLYGSQIELDDGTFVTADDAYLRESILEPSAKITKGYSKGSMPGISLTEEELNSLVAYIKSLE
jgi:cytochrome c2